MDSWQLIHMLLAMGSLDPEDVDVYLERLGLNPSAIRSKAPSLDALARLQSAHVKHVPFENLSIVGDPFDEELGDGVRLDIDHLYDKIVNRGRGGYCYELNGLFTTLLDTLDYDVHHAAAMMIQEGGRHTAPANHLVATVSLNRRYVVDVGMVAPQMRRPTPLDGEETSEDEAAVTWRVVQNDRPAYDRRTEYRIANGDWEPRYDFDPTPRELAYFQASCDYFSSAPESMFTDKAMVFIEVNDGWVGLHEDSFARVRRGEREEREISPDEWYELLEREFGLSVPG